MLVEFQLGFGIAALAWLIKGSSAVAVNNRDWYWCETWCDYTLHGYSECGTKLHCLEACLRGQKPNSIFEWPCCSVCCGCGNCLAHCNHCLHNPIIETDKVCTDWDYRMRHNGKKKSQRVFPSHRPAHDPYGAAKPTYGYSKPSYSQPKPADVYNGGAAPAPHPRNEYKKVRAVKRRRRLRIQRRRRQH